MDTSQDQLRQAIDLHHNRLRREVPPSPEAALPAVLHAQDRLPRPAGYDLAPDPITGHRIPNPGGNKAIALCLDALAPGTPASPKPAGELDDWAGRFLLACGELVEAELVLAHVQTGFMKLVDDGNGLLSAWIATKRSPATWRERQDIDWWASCLRRAHEQEMVDVRSTVSTNPGNQEMDLQLASVYLKMMTYQFGYPPHITLGGLRVETWLDILAGLIAWVLRAQGAGATPTPVPEDALVADIASTLLIPPDIMRDAVGAFTLDRDNAAWHATVPGVAAAPMVRLDGGRLVPSLYGLTTEPLLFLARELRRRDPDGYHNAAQHREAVFRQDLYELFADKRFVRSTGTIRLRHGKGDLRTDIDAVVFDRKTGALGVFELKSQDPFARSAAALSRQRDSVLYANRQLSGVLDWIRRYGAQELLGRVDAPAAKRFRANKVYPFVLGRYLAHFGDGTQQDPRAAWGTWPQVLRLLDAQPMRPADASPIGSLFARLRKDVPDIPIPPDQPPREIALGDTRLMVHVSFASYQAHATPAGDTRNTPR